LKAKSNAAMNGNCESFSLGRTPKIVFGPGSFGKIGAIAAGFGKHTLIVMSRSVIRGPGFSERTLSLLSKAGVTIDIVEISGEPSPDLVDKTVDRFHKSDVASVIGIGGGSAIDAGKAISAMLPLGGSVVEYLEGISDKQHPGCKVPFIAAPTTAGTGSEASANAVLSRTGPQGFKKSVRHENLVPDVALVDPELSLSCPPGVTAACGMDALTQLLEAYVSTRASVMTDVLVESALPRVRESLTTAVKHGATDVDARSGMAYAALVSGIALASAGLGVVHGLASPIGGFFPVPHGVVCGTLLLPATEITIRALRDGKHGEVALGKYARAGSLLSGNQALNREQGVEALVMVIGSLTDELRIPRLSAFGITQRDVEAIVAGAGNKNNPVPLDRGQIADIVLARL
jgi:alcohol dehydrogenase